MVQSQLFFNKCFDKNKLKGLISWSLRNYGESITLNLVERLKNIGFFWATQAGISLSIDDLKIPKEKSLLLLDAEKVSKSVSDQYLSGNLTTVERLQQLIDAWHRTSENLKQEVVLTFRKTDPLNPVYMMAFSGARGNISQVRQLVGMRGLMADPQGRIIDFPIRSNFREGLTLTEYVISCYGARKGIVDTALRTATSGYLTRRLVDVAQHIVVSNYDCETDQGLPLNPLKQGSKILLPLSERIFGRVLAEDVEGVALRNVCISQYLASKISKVRETILVRSPLLCKSKNGVCQLCYGWSLAHHELVSIGEAVGIIAAQSIGEPGTQLTMRTFHTGGVFSGEIIDQVQSPTDGVVYFEKPLKGSLVRTSYGKIGFLTRETGYLKIQKQKEYSSESVAFPSQTILFVRQGQTVEKNEILLEYASSATDQDQGIQATHLVTAPQKGEVFFEDVIVLKDDLNTEIQAYQLGSFWLLTSHLHSSTHNLPGSFNYFPRDLIQANSSLNSTKLINHEFDFSYLTTKVKNKTDQKFERYQLHSKSIDFPVSNFHYQKGNYLSYLFSSFVFRIVLSSEKQNILPYFDNVLLSFSGFSQSLTKPYEVQSTKKPNLFLLFSTLNLWFFGNSTKTEPSSLLYKTKQYYFLKSSQPEKVLSKVKNKRVNTCGNYCFSRLSLKTKSNKTVTQKEFYTFNFSKNFEKQSSKHVSWKFEIKNFSFLNKYHSLLKINQYKETFSLTKERFKPLFPQIPQHFISSVVSRQQPNFSRLLDYFVFKNSFQLNFLVKLSSKNSLLFVLTPNLTNFVACKKLINKQTIDKTLELESNLNFSFESLSKFTLSPVFIVQISGSLNQDKLNWYIDPLSHQLISVGSISFVLLPYKKGNNEWTLKNVKNSYLEWKIARTKFVKNDYILGQIEKKTSQTIEIFKKKTSGELLSIRKNDLFSFDLRKQQKVLKTCFLGSLIRPGKEILWDSTVSQSGQILSINRKALLIRKALPILFSSKANFHVFHGDFIEKGLHLITLTYKRLTTGDIVQGIPRIEQLFEARQTTTVLHEQLQELFETYKTRMRLDLAARKSFQKIQRILIDSIQRVYQSQGVTISDKHLEIIVRQMTSTVRIVEGGRTRLLRGELKPIDWIEKINLGIDIQKAEYEPILLGITKASLETESFISAASFQETTRTLSRAAIEGRTDFLRGLKENVILGHRVPAGTGAPLISYLTKFASDSEIVDDFSSELNFLLKE